jgi:hypothetical protein
MAQVFGKSPLFDTQLHSFLENIVKLALNCTIFFWIIVQLGATVPTKLRTGQTFRSMEPNATKMRDRYYQNNLPETPMQQEQPDR